jgi:hypothetical protein
VLALATRARAVSFQIMSPDEKRSDSAPNRVDAYLSRKAQQRLDARAIVSERADGTWLLSVPGEATYSLGDSFGRAKQALWALIAARSKQK